MDTTTGADYKVTKNTACLKNRNTDFECVEISRKKELTITLGISTPM